MKPSTEVHTAGQERYQAMSCVYFRDTVVCVLVFDLTDERSFKRIKVWKHLCSEANLKYNVCDKTEKQRCGAELANNCGVESSGIPIYVLVGNKLDRKGREVDQSEIEKFCRENQIEHYVETSARDGTGVKTLYDKIGEEACDLVVLMRASGIELSNAVNTVRINDAESEHSRKCICDF